MKRLKDFSVIEGDIVCFEVCIIGDFIFDVEWFSSGEKIEGNEEIFVECDGDIYKFILMDVFLDDDGEYIVIVINRIGKVLCIGKFFVVEKIKKFFFLDELRNVDVIENIDVCLEV